MKSAVRKLALAFLCLLVFTLLLGAGFSAFQKNFVVLNGRPYSRKAEQLDFSGEELPDLDMLAELKNLKSLDLRNTSLTLGEHEWLQRQLPGCRIQWQILIEGNYYLPDTKTITLSNLTDAVIILLDYLPELQEIHLENSREYAPLVKLTEKRPQCRIFCNVELGSRLYDQDTDFLMLKDADVDQLLQRLGALPKVEKIEFTGKLPATRDMNALREKFPRVEIAWRTELYGRTYPETQESLNLSRRNLEDAEELKEKLLYFPYLRTLDLRGTILSPADRKLLQTHYPQVNMVFDYDLDGVQIPADAQVLDLSGHRGLTFLKIEEALPYLPRLQKIILCDCGLPNEELAAFNRKLQNIRVIWSVTVGGRKTRTDEIYFAPNKWGLKMTDANIYDLRYCTDMVCVDIGHSKNVTNCQWAAFMPELRYLILADSNVRGLEPLRNLKKLKFLELFLIPAQDLSPLKDCTALEDLNLCYVYADPAPVKEMTWLKRLWWSGCWPARAALSGNMPHTTMNFDTGSSTGEGWREGKLYFEMRDLIGMGYMKG